MAFETSELTPFDPSLSSLNSLITSQDRAVCWTDDLPVCQHSGIGTATNQIYRENGFRREGHEFEDRSFHFRLENDTCLYGVFDGIGGSKVAAYAAQNMPAEILLGQLVHKNTDDELKQVLHQACLGVEKNYTEVLNALSAERINLLQQTSEGVMVELESPVIYQRLKEIDAELNGATAVLISLVFNNKLYVANIGSCRALLCKQSPDGQLRIVQLTADHNLNNTSEVSRLSSLGVDMDKVLQTRKLAGRFYTRSVGDYLVKREYARIDQLSSAVSSPLIAEPEVYGGFDIDSSCCFLAMMSDGLYRTVSDALGAGSHVNAEIAAIIAAQFDSQTTYRDVAQAAVDQVVRQHYNIFESTPASATGVPRSQAHDDITLIVRGFNYPLAASSCSNVGSTRLASSLGGPMSIAPLSISIPMPGSMSLGESPPRPFFGGVVPIGIRTGSTNALLADTATGSDDEDSSASFDEQTTHSVEETARAVAALALDESGRVASYVDFSEFDIAVEAMSESERKALFAELEPRPDFEPIPEEREVPCVG